MLVADTGNHRIVAMDDHSARLRNLHPLAPPGLAVVPAAPSSEAGPAQATLALAPGQKISLLLQVNLPVGQHLNAEAPQQVTVAVLR